MTTRKTHYIYAAVILSPWIILLCFMVFGGLWTVYEQYEDRQHHKAQKAKSIAKKEAWEAERAKWRASR